MVCICLAEGFFPSLGKARGLFAHEADRILDNMKVAKLCFTRFLLEMGDVDAENFVLLPKIIKLLLEVVGAFSLHLEVGIEMALQLLALVLHAHDFFLKIPPCREAGFPDEKCDKEA